MLVQVSAYSWSYKNCSSQRCDRADQGGVAVKRQEHSGAGASDLRDVEMAGDGSNSGAVDVGMGSAAAADTGKRKKTSPALDMGGDLRSDATGELWRAVSGLRRWEENARSNVEKKKRIDLAAFVELSLVIERACTKLEAREAYLMGRLAERSEIKDVVADECRGQWSGLKLTSRSGTRGKSDSPPLRRLRSPELRFRT